MRQQRGSLYSMAFLALVFGSALLVFFRALPIYIDEFKVRSVMKAVASSPEAAKSQVSVVDLRKALQRRWDIDDINNLKVGEIQFVKAPEGRLMRYDYEVRTGLFANWFLVIQFKKDYILGQKN
ncbi:MAG: DUF4845 domain-containing protein [Oceanococcaceae bacterium]